MRTALPATAAAAEALGAAAAHVVTVWIIDPNGDVVAVVPASGAVVGVVVVEVVVTGWDAIVVVVEELAVVDVVARPVVVGVVVPLVVVVVPVEDVDDVEDVVLVEEVVIGEEVEGTELTKPVGTVTQVVADAVALLGPDTVPGTALVVWVPLAEPPDVLT